MKHQSNRTIHQQTLRPNDKRQSGFTLVEIMIVVLILGVLLNIAMPAMIHARDTGQSKSCVSNLKRISGAKEEYALDNRLPVNSTYVFTWTDLSTYIHGPQPTCPTHSSTTGYTYVFNTIGISATCPYGAPASDPTLVHQYNF
jgi:prepilin-type N-terminal cleavage/methylation domain-containing protein